MLNLVEKVLSKYNTVKSCLEDCCVRADNMHKLSLYLHQIPIMKHTDILRTVYDFIRRVLRVSWISDLKLDKQTKQRV